MLYIDLTMQANQLVYLGAGIELIGVTALQMQVDAFINR